VIPTALPRPCRIVKTIFLKHGDTAHMHFFRLVIAATGFSLIASMATTGFASPGTASGAHGQAAARDGSADFDFLYGRPWHVHNRRLQRVGDSKTWVEFDDEDTEDGKYSNIVQLLAAQPEAAADDM
jgi:hypothetical protein